MNHKKSMRIFWLSLCLLAVSGTIIIAAVQYRSQKNKIQNSYREQENGVQANRLTQPQATQDTDEDAQASAVLKPQAAKEETAADPHTQVQPASGRTAEYRFELKVQDGYLDVYHYHTDNLFFHTGIPYSAMTAKQREELEQGIYFVNEQEMYGYLESCTS
ncbi:MAG: hypothetical protein K2N87_12920 [Eubacterium sp.]|nr:hypothetical protein [Eubacterium sp.]